jgi:hypothetical protein
MQGKAAHLELIWEEQRQEGKFFKSFFYFFIKFLIFTVRVAEGVRIMFVTHHNTIWKGPRVEQVSVHQAVDQLEPIRAHIR